MRILAIRGQNLASLAGAFAIDFTEEPLAGSGIFAITGPTGAGKSTLLDAVCLALFNDIPRLKAAPSGGKIGEAEDTGLSLRDTRAILRHGTGEGFAEVDFAMPGGATYRARWSVKRARGKADGKLQNHDHSFERLDTGERIGGTRTETLAAIRAVIGLSAEQFGRAVLLAQGDFEAFIRADANERAILLERLTGSEIYTALGQRAFEKARTLEAGLDLLRARIADQHGLDDDQRAEAEQALAQAQAAEAQARADHEALKQARAHELAGAQLAQQVASARQALAASEAAASEAAPRRAALALDRRALALAPAWTALAEAEAKRAATARDAAEAAAALARAEAEEAQAQAAQTAATARREAAEAEARALAPALDQARALDVRLAEAARAVAQARAEAATGQQRLATAEAAQAKTRAAHAEAEAAEAAERDWLAGHAALAPLAQREDELASQLADHAARAAAVAHGEGLRGEQEQAQRQALARWTTAEATLREAGEAHEAAQQALAEAEQALPPPDALANLADARDRLTRIDGLLAAQAQTEAALLGAEQTLSRTRERLDGDQARRTALSSRQATLAATLPALAARVAEARRDLALLRAAATDAAEALRAELAPGQPCPVCGSAEHQLDRFEGKLGEHLRRREEAAQALEADHAAQDREAIAAEAEVKALDEAAVHLGRERAEQGRQLDLAAQRREAARADLFAAARALALPDSAAALPDALPEAVSARRAEVEESLAALTTARATADARRQAEHQARAALDTAREAHAAAREALDSRTRALTELDNDLKADRAEAGRLAAALDRWLAPAGAWRAQADPSAWLAALGGEWRARDRECQRLTAALPALRDAWTRAETELGACRTRAEELAAALCRAGQAHAALAQDRAALLEGEAVAAVEQRLAAARNEAEAAHRAAAAAREAASHARVGSAARHDSASAATAAAQADHAGRAHAFAAALAEAGLDADAVARVARAGAEALEAEGEALAALDRALATGRAVLREREADLARHGAGEAPALAGPALAAALAEAEQASAAAADRRAEAEIVLRQDDASRGRTALLRAELDSATAKAAIWLRLGDLIGDRTGATFRRFAQGLTLDRLLEHANARLCELKPRFTLERAPGGDMLIQVLDNDMGGEVRGLHNLSGGERFLVSLALALGLAEMSTASGVKIESLFIDEGFGALDPASLGQAVALLEHLHATGRRVGVISHVEELKERIPVKIEVTPTGKGTSRVEVVGG
ncbi:AAA family ATPase [Novosphingobium bradum]|uniref:AAA family ATPase n=1 Tax=Novosphingobium bradum TaxID=1737444 RepID=A0ABV7ISP5_9SPHN